MRREAFLTAIAALLMHSTASAEPAFARMYKQQYGYAPSCNACHKDGGGTPINAFGQQFKDAGMTPASFATIAELDADGDGIANGAEASAKANPGDERSTPQARTDWLDTASLIPREVQAAFPGVRAYLPKDAVLTDADIARARALGADLSKDDENTIYIPLENQRPAGTALIFLPPTLIAGIYGMNFRHIPELGWLYGYPFAIALMVASAVIPLWVLKRRGWI